MCHGLKGCKQNTKVIVQLYFNWNHCKWSILTQNCFTQSYSNVTAICNELMKQRYIKSDRRVKVSWTETRRPTSWATSIPQFAVLYGDLWRRTANSSSRKTAAAVETSLKIYWVIYGCFKILMFNFKDVQHSIFYKILLVLLLLWKRRLTSYLSLTYFKMWRKKSAQLK